MACWTTHSCRARTPAFIQFVFPDEGHCLYLGNDSLPSSLSSTPPTPTPGHESENVTPQRMGSRSAARRISERERGRNEDRRRGGR